MAAKGKKKGSGKGKGKGSHKGARRAGCRKLFAAGLTKGGHVVECCEKNDNVTCRRVSPQTLKRRAVMKKIRDAAAAQKVLIAEAAAEAGRIHIKGPEDRPADSWDFGGLSGHRRRHYRRRRR